MAQVAIVTDTTACIPADRARELKINTVPIEFIFDGKAYRDGIDISPKQFYKMLAAATTLPTTSGSIPAPYIKIFTELSHNTDNILCITEPVAFSGMYNAATIAAKEAIKNNPNLNIEVTDCSSAAAGLGLTAIAAAEAASKNASLTEVAQTAKKVMQNIHLFAYIDDLYYLVKGGRVPKVARIANSFLQIKPVFTVYDGNAHNVGLPRTEQGAFKEVLRQINRKAKIGSTLRVAVMHAEAPAMAIELETALKEQYNCQDIFITEFTPVMGVHTGPGVVGAAFYKD